MVIYLEICILLILSVYSDFKYYKINNLITLSFILVGLITCFIGDGYIGLICSIYGILLPLALLFPLFLFKMLGAGDVKLFCALGAITGLNIVIQILIYSFLSGGIIGVFVLLVRKNIKQRLKYLISYLKSCFLVGALLPYGNVKDKSDGSKFRFSYAIACGTAISLLSLI